MGFELLQEAYLDTAREDLTRQHIEEAWFHTHIAGLIRKEEETRLSLERTYGSLLLSPFKSSFSILRK
jgi:hypothetical protein